MRTVTKETITDVFASYFGEGTDPRFKEIMISLAKHLHDFARETELTHDEWRKGLEFVEWAGRITTPERNEFVLLSDVMGLSSLVDMIHSEEEVTSSSVMGPFHLSNPPPLAIGDDMKRHYEGEVLLVEGYVYDPEGSPIPGAKLDNWQTAPNGLYSSQDEEQDINSFRTVPLNCCW